APYAPTPDFDRLARLVSTTGGRSAPPGDLLPLLRWPAKAQFGAFCRLGSQLWRHQDGEGLRGSMEALRAGPLDASALRRGALGHGLFLDTRSADQLDRAYSTVQALRDDGSWIVPLSPGPSPDGLP